MIAFLLDYLPLVGLGGSAILAFVAVGLLGGWPLVLNRYGIGALVAVLLFVVAGIAWETKKSQLREEGAQAATAAAVRAADFMRQQTRRKITEFVTESSAREIGLREKLAAAESRVDKKTEDRKGARRVTPKADAACTITRGFVFDHNAALPGNAGDSSLSPAPADVDRAAGVALSEVGDVVSHNYGECSKLLERYEAEQNRRYQSCLAWDAKFGTISGCAR